MSVNAIRLLTYIEYRSFNLRFRIAAVELMISTILKTRSVASESLLLCLCLLDLLLDLVVPRTYGSVVKAAKDLGFADPRWNGHVCGTQMLHEPASARVGRRDPLVYGFPPRYPRPGTDQQAFLLSTSQQSRSGVHLA